MDPINNNNAPHSIPLGQLLVSGGFISSGALKQALSRQKWSPRPLGAILQQSHQLNKVEKKAVLNLQKRLARYQHAFNQSGRLNESLQLSLGALLVENGEISPEQLDSALAAHSRQQRRLGEVLVAQHALSPCLLARWLILQKKLVSAAAVAVCMMAGSGLAVADDSSRNAWQHMTGSKFLQHKLADINHAWGQQKSASLARLSIKNRDLSEISRSRDGTVTLKLSRQGLNIIKRF